MIVLRGLFAITFGAALLLATTASLLAAEQAQADLKKAVAQLADPNPITRQTAAKKLLAAGKDAEPELRNATNSDDPEVAAAARRLLRLLSSHLENVPNTEPPALTNYRAANEGLRRRIILEQLVRPGVTTLARLWAM